MHFTTLITTTLAAVASAGPAFTRQAPCPEVDNIPRCGYPCIEAAAINIGCGTTDYPCMCGQFSALRSAAAGCVLTNCGITGISGVLAAAQAVCDACA